VHLHSLFPHLPRCVPSLLAAASAALAGAAPAQTTVDTTGRTITINTATGYDEPVDTIYTGTGTLWKSGAGSASWGTSAATFALGSGGLIDVYQGSFVGGSGGNENWADNKSDLNLWATGIFAGGDAQVRVDALTGAGRIRSGYLGAGSFTFGVDNGSGVFSGSIADTNTADGSVARLVKEGLGTQILSGNNTFTGGLAINRGAVSVSSDANLGGSGGGISLSREGRLITTASFASGRAVTFGFLGGTFDVASGTTLTWNGNLSGGGQGNSLYKQGEGTLVLAGTNTSPTLHIVAGTVSVSSNENLGYPGLQVRLEGGRLATTASFSASSRSLVVGGGAVDVAAGTTLSWTGEITGSGDLRKEGAGTLAIGANPTYQGHWTIAEGTVVAGSDAHLGRFDATVYFDGGRLAMTGSSAAARSFGLTPQGGTLDVAAGHTLTWSGTVFGQGSLTKQGAGTLVLSGANTFEGGLAVEGGTVFVSADAHLGTGPLALSGGSRLAATAGFASNRAATLSSGGVFDVAADATLAWNGTVSGSGGLRKEGAGALVLSGSQTFSGDLAIAGGAVSVSADASLGDNAGVVALDGGTLMTTGSFASSRGTAVSFGGGAFDVAAGTTLTWNGSIYGPGSVVKRGAGSLVLGGDSSFSGGLSINAGSVSASADANLGRDFNVIAFDGGTLITTGSFAANRGTAVSFGGGTLDVAAGTTLTWNGSIYGPGGVAKQGAGSLVLGGDSSFSGGLTINAGSVSVSADASLGRDFNAITLNGTTLATTGSFTANRITTLGSGGTFHTAPATTLTWNGPIGGNGGLIKAGAGNLVLGGDNAYSGGTTISAGTLTLGHANGASAGTVHIAAGATFDVAAHGFDLTRVSGAGTVTGAGSVTYDSAASATLAPILAGTGGLVKAGTGTLTLSRANSYSGATHLNAGTLALAHNQAFGSGEVRLAGGDLQASGGARALANHLVLDGDAAISGSNALTLTGGLTLARNRDLTVSNTALTTLAGVIDESGGSRVLAKYGDGELVLTGASTYTGGTLIAEGTVRTNNLGGSAFGTGAVTVASGGTLTGAGLFTGALQNNGTYAPGNSPALQALSSFSQGPGGLLIMEIEGLARGAGYDALDVTGSAHFGGTLQVTFLGGFTAAAGQSFDFFNWGGYDGSTFGTLDLPALGAGLAWDSSALYTSGVLGITAAAIPEPSTYAALCGAAALGLAVWRRRRTG